MHFVRIRYLKIYQIQHILGFLYIGSHCSTFFCLPFEI